MSLHPGDWKHFDVLSGQLRITDVNGGDVVVNAEKGEWVVMCEYDDDNKVRLLAAMPERLAEKMDGGKVEAVGVEEHETLDAGSGFVFMADRKLGNKLPKTFSVPEERLNPAIVERYGKPNDADKSDNDRFVESCFHMGRDHRANMPVLENLGFGTICEMPRGELDVNMLYNHMRDVIGIEIFRK